MKDKRPYSEKIEKSIKLNCFFSGLVFIAIGISLALAIATSVIDVIGESVLPVIFLCVLSIGAGIYQMNVPRITKKKEAAKNDTNSAEFSKILMRRENAQQKIRQNMCSDTNNLKWELYSHHIVYIILVTLALAVIGITFWVMYENPYILILIAVICVPLLIYYIFKFGYSGLKKYAAKNNIDFNAVEDDFRNGRFFKTTNSFLGISDLYTIVVTEKERFILHNKDILFVQPAYAHTDHYSNGAYSGTVTIPYVIIGLNDGRIVSVRCAEFAEEIIIDEFKGITAYLHDNFKVAYPQKLPAYWGK